MKIDGVHHRSIWLSDDGWSVRIFDQRQLPWRVEIAELTTVEAAARAIKEMWTRGAPLIGATAAYGLALGLRADASDTALERDYKTLLATRKRTSNQFDGIQAKYSRVILIIGVEMRKVMRLANFHVHANDDPKKAAEFRHWRSQ